MSPHRNFRALAISALLLLPPSLQADDPPPPPGPGWVTPETRARWSASGEFAAGTSLWGPVSPLQDAMFEAGFDDPGRGGFLGSQTVSYPRIHDCPDRVSYWIGFRQGRRGRPWSLGLGAGITGLGIAEGHRAGPYGSDGVFVSVKSTVFTFAPMLWLQAAPVLRLGLGP
ncbi:MAG: hypothetical protein KJ062_09455, partial [Thermoanaerobaculia bacterium]|nr:hypothetical protein [Thermoanaerobaculia bacterium]